MAFTEKDFEVQQEQLRQLEDELSRLNAQFDAQMKTGGIAATDLDTIDMDKLPAEVRTAFDAAQQAARREGESRAGQARPAATAAAKAPGAGRRGAVRL
ncbi:hypothetical protein FVW20_04715 [Desulfovibrio oxamicus]|uniref:Uncharacterized protein n=1 Tax=Nitratidesulfovibrio oxamicus TaxID=32016 RepID=A0ABS0J1N5_9BACT|nr:hypothetical protein [Nitratidesulfovibrio oxamicus]MBG3876345.1 hypothetical protein [Nitratidesulfovibrio oxamicus]